MKRLNILFLFKVTVFITTIVSFISCENKKDDPTIILGTIMNYYSNESISDYKLIIEREEYRFMSPSNNIIIDTIRTDANGEFNYTLEDVCESGCGYNIIAGNNSEYAPIESYSINKYQVNKCNFKVKPYRTIKLGIMNITGKFERITLLQGQLLDYAPFEDTTLYLRDIIPEEPYHLDGLLFDVDGNKDSVINEEIIISNIDTTYIRLEY